MKTKPSATYQSSSPDDARIDAVLHAYAHAVPSSDLESRVANRVAFAARHARQSGKTLRLLIWRRVSVGALAAAAACGIVIGTVQHSQRTLPPMARMPNRSGGVSTGERMHIPDRPMPQNPEINPQSPRTPPHGRAVVNRNRAHQTTGTAVPRSPYPPDTPQ